MSQEYFTRFINQLGTIADSKTDQTTKHFKAVKALPLHSFFVVLALAYSYDTQTVVDYHG